MVVSKEPSPLLDKKIDELEAKFAEIDELDDDLEDLDDDDDVQGTPSVPQGHISLLSDIDLPYTPPQVSHFSIYTVMMCFY